MQAAGGAGPKRLFDLSREGERRLQRSTPRAPGPRAGTASRRSIRDAPGYAVPAAGVVRGLFSRATRALHAPAQRPNTQPVQHGKIIQGQVAALLQPDRGFRPSPWVPKNPRTAALLGFPVRDASRNATSRWGAGT